MSDVDIGPDGKARGAVFEIESDDEETAWARMHEQAELVFGTGSYSLVFLETRSSPVVRVAATGPPIPAYVFRFEVERV